MLIESYLETEAMTMSRAAEMVRMGLGEMREYYSLVLSTACSSADTP
jgi:hypothetical protein